MNNQTMYFQQSLPQKQYGYLHPLLQTVAPLAPPLQTVAPLARLRTATQARHALQVSPTWTILKKLVSAILPLQQREKEQQVSLYTEHPDFISYIPKHQREALHAVQAHAPTDLSVELQFYRNILPCTLQKMIDFKKVLAILDKALSDEQMQLIYEGKLDPGSLISVDPLTDEDIYVAHVIAVNYLMQKSGLQKRADKSPLMMDEQDDIEEPQLSYPCGQQSYTATVNVHHALSKVLPSGLVNGVISN